MLSTGKYPAECQLQWKAAGGQLLQTRQDITSLSASPLCTFLCIICLHALVCIMCLNVIYQPCEAHGSCLLFEQYSIAVTYELEFLLHTGPVALVPAVHVNGIGLVATRQLIRVTM